MQFKRAKFSLFFVLTFFPAILLADFPALPQPSQVIPSAPAIAARSYILIDPMSNYVIAEQYVDQRVEPASLTKMMTAYVVDHTLKSGKLKLQDKVHISSKAWKMEGSRMFLEPNTYVPVEELLRGVIVSSGNDASVALAEHIAGSESAFAEFMNFYAKKLGMVNTHFVNSTGMPDPNHYTTARDMAILAKALIQEFPESYTLYSQKEYVYNNIKQPNRNRLLWQSDWVDGIKTGHTESAGFCLVASGQKEGMRLIAVVMGTQSDSARVDETNKLLAYGFRFFESRKLYAASTPLKTARIWLGNKKDLNLGLAQDLYVTIGHGQYERLKAAINIDQIIKAPAPEGAVLGTLSVQLDDKTIAERPIVALNEINKGGLLSRIYDHIALSVQTVLGKLSS